MVNATLDIEYKQSTTPSVEPCNPTRVPLLCNKITIRLPTASGGLFCYGAGMSVAIADTATIPEIDEALRHLSLVPLPERGTAWHAYSDALLERRRTLETDHA